MKHKAARVVGRIDPQSLYTSEGCMRHFGLGRELLLEARKSGMVDPIPIGRRLFYVGHELVAWAKTLPRLSQKVG